jgi:transcriptional regulator with XRE-family HTH domain
MNSAALHLPHASVTRDLGVLLREWRTARRLSQSDLATDAELSNRHLSCIETGKSRPSRDVIERLADALDIPLRERNALLLAAGYAPAYRETSLDQPELARIRQAIHCILAQQEPYPAFVLDRRWDILSANGAAVRINAYVMGGPSRHDNMIRQFFDPDDLRRAIGNWDEIAGELLRHLHERVATVPTDLGAKALLDEVLRYPGVPVHWRRRDVATAPLPIMTTVLRRGDQQLRFFSTITTFGTPRDVTLDELHIECCFPVDRETELACAALARDEAASRDA